MLSRIFKVCSARTLAGNVRLMSSGYKAPAFWYPAHYDELPIPQGSWQVAYEAKQRKYNFQLVIGAAFFLFTLSVMKTSGKIFLNWSPPPYPEGAAEETNEECAVVVKKC